jgi:MFS family permease
MMDANILFALLMAGTIGLMYLAGRIAERRGRSFKTWALIASMIGPLVFPLVYLFPNLHRRNGDHA